MAQKQKLVMMISNGLDDERSSVAWSIANGGVNNGLEVSIFLVSNGIDWVRKGAADNAHPNPKDPSMKEMIDNIFKAGCRVMACPPCAAVRGYSEAELLDGVEIIGSTPVHELIKEGAAVISL